MNAKGYSTIPNELFDWITFLTQALPPRSIRTFIELLIGAMLTGTGFVTEAYLSVNMANHWSSDYKWLQQGKWSWLKLTRRFIELVLKCQSSPVVHLIVDDTVTLRASKKAPGAQIHHQHGNKPNLSNYVLGQCWVSLAIAVQRANHSTTAIPLLSRLTPSVGNTGKLIAANTLIRAVYRLFGNLTVRVLVDCRYMRKRFIHSMIHRGFHVIGQVRIDTRLYDPPPPRKPKQRGRPRKYGDKYTPDRVQQLKPISTTLTLYGRTQSLRYRSKILKARFLGGQLVRVVWCQFQDQQGHYKQTRLLLSTDITLSAQQVIKSYELRWSIEPMFHQLKHAWGSRQAWQQTRQTLHRWVHITSISYGLVQLLSALESSHIKSLCQHSPWRMNAPTTAGQIRKGLTYHFRHVKPRRWWNATCKKFEPPESIQNQ